VLVKMFLCGVWATIGVGVDMVMHDKKIQILKCSKIVQIGPSLNNSNG